MAAIINPHHLPLLCRRQSTSRIFDPAMNAHNALPLAVPTSPEPSSPPPAAMKSSQPQPSSTTIAMFSSPPPQPYPKLRLSKGLTIPDGKMVYDACHRMTARRVNTVMLTDGNGLLAGITTYKDVATRVIAKGQRMEQTFISKIMMRNSVFVMAEAMAIVVLQKIVQGKFRHLPVVENDEVIAMLDIKKCLYDAIPRMEKAAAQGSDGAAAVEGVEWQWGSNFSGTFPIDIFPIKLSISWMKLVAELVWMLSRGRRNKRLLY